MTKTKQTLGEKMFQMSVVLNNIQDEKLSTSLGKFGYDAARLNTGRVVYNESLALIEAQKLAYADKLQATSAFNVALEAAKGVFNDNVIIARRALIQDLGSIRDLGITGKRPRNFEVWFKTAQSFYNTALSNNTILNQLSVFGVTTQSLQDGLFLVNSIEPLYSIQKNKMGLAQVARMARDAKLEEMHLWYSDFISMARISFRKDPQQLERFGIVKYSQGYKPKKKDTTDTTTPKTVAKITNTEYNLDNPSAE
jgi:hypothetical protein